MSKQKKGIFEAFAEGSGKIVEGTSKAAVSAGNALVNAVTSPLRKLKR